MVWNTARMARLPEPEPTLRPWLRREEERQAAEDAYWHSREIEAQALEHLENGMREIQRKIDTGHYCAEDVRRMMLRLIGME